LTGAYSLRNIYIGQLPAQLAILVASQQDLDQLKRLVLDQDTARIVKEMPPIPNEVKLRFPSMVKYESDLRDWTTKHLAIVIRGGPI